MSCIYQYVNKINGHMYIGMTNNPKRRWYDHWSAATNPKNKDYNSAFHRALRKYGKENFEYNILEDNIDENNLPLLKERERYWIDKYNTYEDREHYNETPGGDSVGEKYILRGEDHPGANFTNEEVEFCRRCYREGKRSRDIYEQYFKDRLTYAGFINMWHGRSWKHIMPEVFETNPHPGRYTAKDRDYIVEEYKKSGLSLKNFQRTDKCYVGWGTLWNMVNHPEFYDNK